MTETNNGTQLATVDFNAQFGAVIPEGLDKAKVESILARFREDVSLDPEVLSSALGIVVTDESQTDLIKQARDMRLAFRSDRLRIENTRKDLKEQSLREGQLIDGIARTLKEKIEPAEKHLEAQEKFIELRAIERKEKLRAERTQELLAVEYNLTPDIDLANMHPAVYASLLSTAKNLKAELDQAAADAEAERIRLERERVEREAALAAENERLQIAQEKARKEAEKKAAEHKKAQEAAVRQAAEAAKERRRLEAEIKEKEEAARKEKARLEAEIARKEEEVAAKERARIEAENARIAKEQAEKERIEREAAEEKARKEAAEREAAAAPDRQKLMTWLVDLQPNPPIFADEAINAIAQGVAKDITAIIRRAKNQALEAHA